MPTILIVDDDAALRDSLAETVHDLGHQAKLAASGREALAIFASDEIDGVLLDLRMPSGMDGIEVLRRIRAQQNGPPVVVLTAFASAENTIEAMRIVAQVGTPDEQENLRSTNGQARRSLGDPFRLN